MSVAGPEVFEQAAHANRMSFVGDLRGAPEGKGLNGYRG